MSNFAIITIMLISCAGGLLASLVHDMTGLAVILAFFTGLLLNAGTQEVL